WVPNTPRESYNSSACVNNKGAANQYPEAANVDRESEDWANISVQSGIIFVKIREFGDSKRASLGPKNFKDLRPLCLKMISCVLANEAMKAMDGQELNGRSIRVSLAIERSPRLGRFGGGGGGYNRNFNDAGNDQY
ncbi:glycine-rich RNA-binding protein 2, mitochondrial-like protein, partial [Tanacetum coccineum]